MPRAQPSHLASLGAFLGPTGSPFGPYSAVEPARFPKKDPLHRPWQ